MILFSHRRCAYVCERLKSLRKKCGYTQVSLAETLGVSKGTVAMWETGKRTPDFETLIRLSDLFDVRTDYILGKPTIHHQPNCQMMI